MTAWGKACLALTLAAAAGAAVGRALEPTPMWFWWCIVAALAAAVAGSISEARRLRKAGLPLTDHGKG